jgi:hypothetical protein
MLIFNASLNTLMQWPAGAVFHCRSTQRLSSFVGDLKSFYSGAESFFSFAQAYAGGSFGSPLIFAAR